MKGKSKRKFTPEFKLKVVLEVLKEKDTLATISKRHELHPNQISDWKKQFLLGAASVFETGTKLPIANQEPETALLYEQIGRLQMELTAQAALFFQKKVDAMSLSQRRALIDSAASASIRQQCQWVGLARSAYYYQPIKAQAEDLLFMRLLDEQYLQTPQYGYRKMQIALLQAGYSVNHKRVRRLMKTLGIEAIYPKINTSKPAKGHRVYPYLLRGLVILRVHQVWATDITYVPMATGYMYLMAIIDLHSRYVLSWSVSNTMEAEWCCEVLRKALGNYPQPEIFNTDQGSQFTSDDFTTVLLSRNIRISMDGKGRALDNIVVERLWRTVKYEPGRRADIYLKAYQDAGNWKQDYKPTLTFITAVVFTSH